MSHIATLMNAAPQLWEGAVKAWNAAQAAANHASTFWIAADKDCKNAVILATNTCLGYVPERYAAGFGPFCLAWGWMLMGFLIGWLASLHVPSLTALWRPIYARLMARQRPWHHAVQSALLQAADGPRKLVLQRLLDDGDDALQLLAANSGVSPGVMLGRVLENMWCRQMQSNGVCDVVDSCIFG